MKFVIDRSLWRTGKNYPCATGKGDTCLKNEEGFKCCLGFCMEQLGYQDILGVETPITLDKVIKSFTNNYDGYIINTKLSINAMGINDSRLLPSEKEERLKKLFEEYGHEIEFINDYVTP